MSEHPALEFDVQTGRETTTHVELNRVGTCMAWQWMCPHYCGYVLGINADRDDITAKAARHLDWHTRTQPDTEDAP